MPIVEFAFTELELELEANLGATGEGGFLRIAPSEPLTGLAVLLPVAGLFLGIFVVVVVVGGVDDATGSLEPSAGWPPLRGGRRALLATKG